MQHVGTNPRGRVVMIVDNGVRGDSRVQKAAYSAAEAGWDVVLLGRSQTDEPEAFDLGRARVELLPVGNVLGRSCRRRPLRRPLAYPQNGIAKLRQQQMWAWRADLGERSARLAVGSAGRPTVWARWRQLAQRVELLVLRAAHRWVTIRSRQLAALRRANAARDTIGHRVRARVWRALRGDRYWRHVEPQLWEYELAFADRVDALRPDIVHANDFRVLGVGARAKQRAQAAGRQVKLVWDAHEYLPGMRPWHHRHEWLAANAAHEREYAPAADAVVTVSDELAALLHQRHGLPHRPAVVRNAPELRPMPMPADEPGDLRARCGVGPATPLLVYSGVAAEQRGLDLVVDGLTDLPGVHVALIVPRPDHPYVVGLLTRATEIGVTDRVHVLPLVAYWQVVPFVAGADVGLSPIHRWTNYDVALSTKFYEYSQARLPIVSSDVRTAAATIRATGQGEVFRAGDRDDYVRAVRAVLADPARYRAAYDKPDLLAEWTWEAQAAVLDEVYRRLLPVPPRAVAPRASTVMATQPG